MEMLTEKDIIAAAKEAGLPKGWYQYDGGGPDCLREFARLIEMMVRMKSIIKHEEVRGNPIDI